MSGQKISLPYGSGSLSHAQNQDVDLSLAHLTQSRSATQGRANITRTSTTAEFPLQRDDRLSVLRRDAYVGGPVTTATIRFPPKHIADALDENQTSKHNHLKSLGRVVFARGPWIESHPLVPSYRAAESKSITQALEDKSCYKTIAFGGFGNTAGGGTSTFETISGMIFPSSSSSALSYLNDSSSSRVESSHSINTRISVVAFGGRRISFLSGGGLWSNTYLNQHKISDAIDEFVLIPIAKTDTLASSSFEISDWIHDIRLLNVELPQENKQSAFLLAVGMTNNNCEIFGFHSLTRDEQEILQPARLQCITSDVRCITYSLTFHGWDNTRLLSSDAQIPSLAIASGTVFSEIVVWNINPHEDKDDEQCLDRLVKRWLANTNSIKASRIRRTSLHRLRGHLGSIFSVRFSNCGRYIASTSDDRTVRLFQQQLVDESKSDTKWNLIWTGWGHTARVFDVSFAYPSFDYGDEPSHPILVSAGEDSTTRIWNPLQTKEVTHPLRGHDCESVWTVDFCDDIIVTGGNDGCVKLWNLDICMMQGRGDIKTFVVPKDPTNTPTSSDETTTSEVTMTKPRKKQKKKPKVSGQLICGMELYKGHKLVVATRAGGLFTLDLRQNTWTKHKCWHDNVISSEDKSKLQVDATTGTCISVSPSAAIVIVGTTEGWLVVASLDSSNDSSSICNYAFRCPSYHPVQSISWIDDDNVVVFYARGSVIWFKMEETLVPLHILALGTPGIPLSFAYDYKQSMYIGDSRGNLAYFDISQSYLNEIAPTSVLKAHAKEHVTAVSVMASGIIVSVGNDGCMHQSKVANGKLQRLVSIPVPATTGLKHIWNVFQTNGQENVILGGFYGNDYVVTDNVNGYEFVRIETGGRQKRQDFQIGFSNGFHAMAICTGNVIDVHSSQLFHETSALPRSRYQMIDKLYSIGHSYHAETVNDAAWIECGNKPAYFLSGSNDCSVKLLEFRNGTFASAKELPPHESCVRGVCASSHPTTNTSLLVTCGGKLTMEFYLLDHSSADIDSSVSALCSYRTTGSKATIDHRMNAVRSVPLPSGTNYHLVVSGDSEGNIHVVIVSELPKSRNTTIGEILKGNGRPVLCLELVIFNGFVLAFVGTTGGVIQLWTFNIDKLLCCCNESEGGLHKLGGVLPTTASCEFQAHQSGVNDLSASTVSGECESVVVCSVGDDQAVSTCLFHFAQLEPGSLSCESIRLCTTKCASASALKAVELVLDDSTFHRVYTSGHDNRVTLWKLEFARLSLAHVTSAPIGTEGSCLNCCQYEQPDGTIREVVAVGGVGTELLSFNLNTLLAASVLRGANVLLVTAGAGFSADSGLQTYEQTPLSYKEMCDPSKLVEDPAKFQQFWLAFTRSYLKTKPHFGYEVLDQWCHGGKLPSLIRQAGDSTPWWVYTSNVDGHFRRTRLASFRKSMVEIHGCALEFKCACGIGFAKGEPRLGWDNWNEKVQPKDACRETKLVMSEDVTSSSLILCSHCQLPMRPNVLMFHDTDDNILRSIRLERERYQAWEASVEEDIEMGRSLVVLEIGCGPTVPAVREESEEVVMDCAAKIIQSKKNGVKRGSVSFVRINLKHAEIKLSATESTRMISIFSGAEAALREIDRWIELFQ
ncbi:hypothetical protein ACHAXM_004864 [Skeletonema potamos]